MNCPQCGEPSKEFREGYCIECADENQTNLDQHNAEFDAWEKKTDRERLRIIRDAIRNPTQ